MICHLLLGLDSLFLFVCLFVVQLLGDDAMSFIARTGQFVVCLLFSCQVMILCHLLLELDSLLLFVCLVSRRRCYIICC